MTEVIAFSYAALQPSKGLLDKYLGEIEKLEKQGAITEQDHQLLRSSDIAQRELMNLTLGEEDALTDQTITETLARVTTEIKKEENEKYREEQAAHLKTQQDLAAERAERQSLQKRLYWRCHAKATACAWVVSIIVGVLTVVGLVAGIGLTTSSPVIGWILFAGSGILIFVTLGNLFLGTTVKGLHSRIHAMCLTWLLRRESLVSDRIHSNFNWLPPGAPSSARPASVSS